MSKFNRLTFLLAVISGLGGPVAALAQSSPPGPSAPPPGVSGPSGPEQGGASGPPQIPVLAITNIEVQRTSQSPAIDEVRVRGVTGTKGWSNAGLIPITHGVPSDGILDLVLVATPSEGNGASGFGQLEAALPVHPGHPYKGVRVRGASNAVTVKAMPGSAQAKAPGDDCSKCVGKVFVAKGATPPAGVAAADIAKQDDLPGNLRIVRPTDGIGETQSNPNRLTLVIGEDGKIVDAAWD